MRCVSLNTDHGPDSMHGSTCDGADATGIIQTTYRDSGIVNTMHVCERCAAHWAEVAAPFADTKFTRFVEAS